MPEAQVEAEAAQGAQPGGEPVDLAVPVHRLPAQAPRRPARGGETVGQLGDRLLQAVGDGREVPLVAGDQSRFGFGGEAFGQVEHAGFGLAPTVTQLHTHFYDSRFRRSSA
ncbi:hypothetical protein GCM10018780_64010 [Streptomyces lanatus]|nr:hypothetical protein GCM10018780_64010 [Streptomyces lanatus]